MDRDRINLPGQAITRDDFLRYERVRRSGVTNMWAVPLVARLAALGHAQVVEIMRHYGAYDARYLADTSSGSEEAA